MLPVGLNLLNDLILPPSQSHRDSVWAPWGTIKIHFKRISWPLSNVSYHTPKCDILTKEKQRDVTWKRDYISRPVAIMYQISIVMSRQGSQTMFNTMCAVNKTSAMKKEKKHHTCSWATITVNQHVLLVSCKHFNDWWKFDLFNLIFKTQWYSTFSYQPPRKSSENNAVFVDDCQYHHSCQFGNCQVFSVSASGPNIFSISISLDICLLLNERGESAAHLLLSPSPLILISPSAPFFTPLSLYLIPCLCLSFQQFWWHLAGVSITCARLAESNFTHLMKL